MGLLTGILAIIGLVVLIIIGAVVWLIKGKGTAETIRNGFIEGAKQGAISSLASHASRNNPDLSQEQAEKNVKAIIEEVKKRSNK